MEHKLRIENKKYETWIRNKKQGMKVENMKQGLETWKIDIDWDYGRRIENKKHVTRLRIVNGGWKQGVEDGS